MRLLLDDHGTIMLRAVTALAILIIALNVVARRSGDIVGLFMEIGLKIVKVIGTVLGHTEYYEMLSRVLDSPFRPWFVMMLAMAGLYACGYLLIYLGPWSVRLLIGARGKGRKEDREEEESLFERLGRWWNKAHRRSREEEPT